MKKKAISVGLGVLIVLAFGAKNVSAQDIPFPGPYPTIQAAIDAAANKKVNVRVAAGTYNVPTNEAIRMKDGVSLIGAGSDVCILVGASGQAVIICDYIGNTTIIEGFTITHISGEGGRGIYCGNSSPIIRNNVIIGNSAASEGGGICCNDYSSPSIYNNTISNNTTALGGGGIYCYNHSSPSIDNNIITSNTSPKGGGGISCVYFSSPTITYNRIEENKALSGSNLWEQGGGGILCFNTSATITNNIIKGNSADWTSTDTSDVGGGGILCYQSNSSATTIINNIIASNTTDSRGGGISCYYSSPTIVNNLIAKNSAGLYGGGISCELSSPTITNNTITKNTADGSLSGGGIYCWYSSSFITNNIITDNTATTVDPNYQAGGIFSGRSSSLTVNSNDVYNNITFNYTDFDKKHDIGGIDNVSSDPKFVNLSLDDYHLQASSPCIDKGDNGAPGLAGITSDLDGNPRFADGDGDGYGDIDMGAYEHPAGVTISGTVTDGTNPIQGVTISFSHNAHTETTAADGTYSYVVNYGTSTTLTPSHPGYGSWTPSSRTLTNISANKPDQNFTGTLNTYTISGTVTSGGTGLANVVMNGLPGNPVTNAEGYYTATVNYGWSGTVTPALEGYTFDLASTTYTNVTSNQATGYTATLLTYTISGTVTSDGTGLPNVAMNGLPGNPVTNAEGYYTATVNYGWTGTATPTKEGYTFNPAQRGYTTPVTSDITDQNYAATLLTYTITATAGEGGSISPSGTVSVNHGAKQAFTVTADAGYRISDVVVDGSSIGAESSCTFTKVTADHTIQASFIKTYTITPSAGPGGTISPSTPVIVDEGGSCVFTITPDPGYYIANVKVDDRSVGCRSSYTFRSVNADHTIQATFIKIYTITASAGPGGSIHPSGSFHVPYDHSRIFLIKPDRGYHIDDVKVDDVSVGQVSFYIFKKVDADHSIHATFAKNEELSAVVNIEPNTLNLKSKSDQNAITAYIELPKGYKAEHIIVATVKMDVMGTMVSAQLFPSWVDDHDHDRVPDRVVKFSRQEVIAALAGRTGDITLTVSGQLIGGTTFSGKDTIRVK